MDREKSFAQTNAPVYTPTYISFLEVSSQLLQKDLMAYALKIPLLPPSFTTMEQAKLAMT